MGLLLKTGPTELESIRDIQNGVLLSLVQRSSAAKAVLAERLRQRKTSASFEDIYMIGDGAAEAIAMVVLSPEAWATEEERDRCEEDVFKLYIAKLLEVGDDDNCRAMKGISRLLTMDGQKLQSIIDEDMFDMILSCLDYRNPMETRSPATLATAKFLEAAGDRGQTMLTNFVTIHYARKTTEDLILAFSAAAAVFPIATPVAASMFLIEGFLPSLVPLLERKANSKRVGMAALEMLNAACVDSACRESIGKHCLDWIEKATKSNEGQVPVIASVILAKIQAVPNQSTRTAQVPEQLAQLDDIVSKLMKLLFKDPKNNRNSVFEGLAHQSVRASIKEKLVNDRGWLQIFLQEIREAASDTPAVFGGLVIVENLTAYIPILSEEQKRMAQLKAYANANPSSSSPDPLNEELAVSRRCKALLDVGAVSTIVDINRKLSPSCLALAFKILLSIAHTPKHRGSMAQQGAVKMLSDNWNRVRGTPAQSQETRQNAGQALARVLISIDPSTLFGPSGNGLLRSAIPPLVSLLNDDSTAALEGPRNLLPKFEALLALTNLASMHTNGAPEVVIKTARATIEDLILSSNENIRRAATQLMCNLVQHPDGIVLFANGSPEAGKRLHILLALAGSDDFGTRKAAGGALAELTGYSEVIDALNKQEKGMELLLAMFDDENDEMTHRAVVCVTNILTTQGKSGEVPGMQMRQLGVKGKLNIALARTNTDDVAGVADLIREALMLLE